MISKGLTLETASSEEKNFTNLGPLSIEIPRDILPEDASWIAKNGTVEIIIFYQSATSFILQ